MGVACCYSGSLDEGEKVVSPLKDSELRCSTCACRVLLLPIRPCSTHRSPRRWYYFRACDVAHLTDEVIDITVDHALRINSPFSALTLWQRGGAVARVGEDETAFGGRSAGHTFNIGGIDRDRPRASTKSGSGSGTSGQPSSLTTRASM